MRRWFLVPLLFLGLAACSQGTGGAFTQVSPPASAGPVPQPQLDLAALTVLRAHAASALLAHLPGGSEDLSWGPGAEPTTAGPYAAAPPEADAASLQALQSLARVPVSGVAVPPPGSTATATTDAFKQLEGARGGAYLLLADAAHPVGASAPSAVDPTPSACPSPGPGPARPECLRRQVSDGLLAAYFATDTRMFFKVGETTTVYRPIDALAVGSALVVAGFQQHDENKISAGGQVIQKEMQTDVDTHYGMLYGLVTATAQGGHSVTDYGGHLADQAGAAEALLEAFDASREQAYMADARRLLQPLMDEAVALRAPSGGYVAGFDLQSAGPADNTRADVLATILVLQASRHYDRDDGGHFVSLEQTAAATLLAALDSDRKAGGDTLSGIPAEGPAGGVAGRRSGLATALAVTVLGDVLRDLGAPPSPSPAASQ